MSRTSCTVLQVLAHIFMARCDTAYSVLDLVLHRQPFPSVADAFYLAAYPLLGAGLVVFTGRGAISWGGRLEVAIFATSMALPLWVLVAGPVLEDPAVTALATFCDLAYPAGDLLLLALLLRLGVAVLPPVPGLVREAERTALRRRLAARARLEG